MKILEKIKNKFKKEKVKIGNRFYFKIKSRVKCRDCAFRHYIWDCLEAPECEGHIFKEVD